MKHRDLNAPPAQQMADIVRALKERAESSKTTAHGHKHMGTTGNASWTDPETGEDWSVRVIPPRLEEYRVALGEAQAAIDVAKQAIADERADREAALADALAALSELEGALAPLPGEVADLASALATAQEVASGAQSVADAAAIAADAANQAALTAAGIAEAKGRVIYSDTRPGPEDESAANLWVKPADASTWVWDTAAGDWLEVEDADIRAAAQNAAEAAAAAAVAQSTAEAAKSNAATAQAAAEAAQRTADKATTDARDAHNEAVAAQEAAAAIRADMLAGPTLWEDPSFERGRGPQPTLRPGEIERVSERARDGQYSIRFTANGSGGSNYGAYGYADLVPGHTYQASAWIYSDHDQQWQMWLSRSLNGSVAGLGSYGPHLVVNAEPGKWVQGSTVFSVPADDDPAIRLRYTSMQSGFYNSAARAGQTVYLDELRLVDITDTYPQYLAAQEAADAAQARAEEAYTEAASKATPEQVTAEITASANGKNAIRVAATPPSESTPGIVAGDVWWQVDAAGVVFAQWRWTPLPVGWVPVQVRSEVIANLDVSKLVVTGEGRFTAAVVDRLFADVFAAHKITAEQVTIAALAPDGTLKPGSVGAITLQDGIVGADQIIATEVAAEVSNLVRARVEKLTVTDGALIDSAVILALASEMITAGVLRTADAGQRVVIDGNGLTMFGVDPDGVEYEMVRLGPSGENLLTIGDTTVAPGGVATPSVSTAALEVAGEDLQAILDRLPRGRVARNTYTVNSEYSDRAQSRLSTNFVAHPNRRYRVTVPPLYLQATAATDVLLRLVYSWDTLRTTWDSAMVTMRRSRLVGSTAYAVPGLAADIPTGTSVPRDCHVTLMVMTEGSPVRVVGTPTYPVELTVDDVGPWQDDVGAYWTVGNLTEGSTTPAPVAPETKRQTKRYNATGARTYWTATGAHDTGTSDVVQGSYNGTAARNRYGGWQFESWASDLQGATIESITFTVKNDRWYNSSGGIAELAMWSGGIGTMSGTGIKSSLWPRGTERTFTIPSRYFDGIRNGSWGGFGFLTGSNSPTSYGRFSPTRAYVTITYRK